jgi:hypothetical protein
MIWLNIFAMQLMVMGNAWFDAWKIKREWRIMHGLDGAIQGTILLGSAIWFGEGFWGKATLFIFNLCFFWLQFDYILNFLRRKHWWHLGSALFDQILKGYDLRYWRLALKILLAAVALVATKLVQL